MRQIKRIVSALLVIVSFLAAVKFLSQIVYEHYDEEIIVCLDAGHGGSDSGAVSDGETRLEKNDNLALTLKVKEKLEAKGITVVLTREDDSDVSLKERCRIANRKHCDLFISIHRNSAGSSANGVEAWIATTAGLKENKAAKAAVENICGVTGQKDRGVKRGYRDSAVGNYYTNSGTKMPSMLLEVGFITNDGDNSVFDSKLDECAEAIVDAVIYSFF